MTDYHSAKQMHEALKYRAQAFRDIADQINIRRIVLAAKEPPQLAVAIDKWRKASLEFRRFDKDFKIKYAKELKLERKIERHKRLDKLR